MIDGHEMRFLLYMMTSQRLPANATSNGGDASRVGHKSKDSHDRRVISAACEPLLGV